MTDYADLRKRLGYAADLEPLQGFLCGDGSGSLKRMPDLLREAREAIAALERERNEACKNRERVERERADDIAIAKELAVAALQREVTEALEPLASQAALMSVDLHPDTRLSESCSEFIDRVSVADIHRIAALHARLSPPPSLERSKEDGKDTE